MKLSKDDLSFALNCAKNYFYDSLNSDYPNKDDQKNAELFHLLEQEADNDALEIEGYERLNWTKFDQNDESTFPPCEGVYLVCRGVEPYFREAKFYGEKVGFGDTCVILWRPLPKLPLEIDGRYIREDRPECFYSERKACK